VRQGKEKLILAKALANVLQGEYKILKQMPGSELANIEYEPLFSFIPLEKPAHYTITADFVTLTDGTGIVHIAPAFGEDDLKVGKAHDLPVIQPVDEQGRFIETVTPWRGLFVKDADPKIITNLKERGLMYRAETVIHTYPFCWRCSTPLLYYARTSWFIRTTAFKKKLQKNNDKINWYPEHIKYGRFGDFLDNVVDWALSRDRYWGTPLPIWVCESCGHQHCIASASELEEMAKEEPEGTTDLHRPYIDEYVLECPECEGDMHRVPEVIDALFDSGAMPIAQWHYPYENREELAKNFPADYICEAIDQTRGWFYSLHAIATILFGEPSYKNVICLGLILGEDGEKMSKSRGNVVDPWSVLNVHGADALRWYLFTAAPPGDARRFSVDLVGEVVRQFILTLWNTYSFWVTYATIDNFNPAQHQLAPEERSLMDRWLLSQLNALVAKVTDELEAYDVPGAGRAIADFVNDLSNWYVRRGRRRYWKSEEDVDKVAAYLTLYETLVALSHLLAPFVPFISEEIYQNLVRGVNPQAEESVHLRPWPRADLSLVDEELNAAMALTERIVVLGRAARNKSGLKVRQPLSRLLVKVRSEDEERQLTSLQDQILDELNVKELVFIEDESEVLTRQVKPRFDLLGPKYGARLKELQQSLPSAQIQPDGRVIAGEFELEAEEVEIVSQDKEGFATAEDNGYLAAVDTTLTPDLISECLTRELIHRIQTMRKEAEFNIQDKIKVYFEGTDAVERAMADYGLYIMQETLAVELNHGRAPAEAYSWEGEVNDEGVVLGVERV